MSAPSVFGPSDFFGTLDALFTFMTALLTLGEMGKMIAFVTQNTESGSFEYYKRDVYDATSNINVLVPRRGGRGGGFGGSSGGNSGGGGGGESYAYASEQTAALVMFAIGGALGLTKVSVFFRAATRVSQLTRSGNYALAQRQLSVLLWNLITLTVLWAALGIASLIIDGIICNMERGNTSSYWTPFWEGYPLNVAWVLFMTITVCTTATLCAIVIKTSKRLQRELHMDEKINAESTITPSMAPSSGPFAAPPHQQYYAQHPPAAYQRPQSQPTHSYPAPSPAPYAPSPSQPHGTHPSGSVGSPPVNQPGSGVLEHNHPVKTAVSPPQSSQGGDGSTPGFSPALLSGLPGAAPAGWTVSSAPSRKS